LSRTLRFSAGWSTCHRFRATGFHRIKVEAFQIVDDKREDFKGSNPCGAAILNLGGLPEPHHDDAGVVLAV